MDKDNQRAYQSRADAYMQKAEELFDKLLEKEESKPVYKHKSTIVNSSIVKSAEYRKRLGKLSNNERINRSVWNRAKEILFHRSGTKYEDLAFIDSFTGKFLINKDYSVELKAKPSGKMVKMLQKAKPYTIIGVHNHPLSSVPSIADINTCFARKYKYGVVVCHNGMIYKYSVNPNGYNESILVLALAKLEKEGYNNTIESMFIDSGVNMEVL